VQFALADIWNRPLHSDAVVIHGAACSFASWVPRCFSAPAFSSFGGCSAVNAHRLIAVLRTPLLATEQAFEWWMRSVHGRNRVYRKKMTGPKQ